MPSKKSIITAKVNKMLDAKGVGRGYIKIDQTLIDENGYKIGDIIELYNSVKNKNAAAKLIESIAEDTGTETVRIDRTLRRNLEVKLEDTVTIRRVKTVYANKVKLAPLEQAVILRNTSQLSKLLKNRAITKEDILSFNALGRRIDFIIIDFEPSYEVLVIKEDTEIEVTEETYEELMFDPKDIIPSLHMISKIYEEISIKDLKSKIDTPGKNILPILEDFILDGTIKARIKRDFVVFDKKYESDENYINYIEKKDVDIKSKEKKKTIQEISVINAIFEVSDKIVDPTLISVMMPFSEDFNGVYQMLKNSCDSLDLTCKRADEIWKYEIIIQDLIDLIYCSSVVIVDLTNKNPNVFYETGIAHALKKNVILLTQHDKDVPFDLRHIRYLKYDNTIKGLEELRKKVKKRLESLIND